MPNYDLTIPELCDTDEFDLLDDSRDLYEAGVAVDEFMGLGQ